MRTAGKQRQQRRGLRKIRVVQKEKTYILYNKTWREKGEGKEDFGIDFSKTKNITDGQFKAWLLVVL